MKTFEDLFYETLKDIYYAEKAILKALPKMAKKAYSESLASAFETHYEETQGQVERLEQVFELIGKSARSKRCEAIEGIIAEGKGIMESIEDGTVRDAGMLAVAQAVEHYEISRYGTLCAWAEKLGLEDVVELLEETLEEEKDTDQILTDLAESEINIEAEEASEEEEEAPRSRRASGGRR